MWCSRLLYRGSEHWLYFWVYDNYRACELPWDSAFFWCSAAIAVDFCYYWMHRASHGNRIIGIRVLNTKQNKTIRKTR